MSNGVPMPWLTARGEVLSKRTHLSQREVGAMFNRSASTICRDCKFLGLDASYSVEGGGSISIDTAWTLYLYYCWVIVGLRNQVSERGLISRCYDKSGAVRPKNSYWADVSPSDEENPSVETSLSALRESFMHEIGGSEADFDDRWIAALDQANKRT